MLRVTPPPPNIPFFSFSFYLFSVTFQKKSENFGGGGLNPLNPPPLSTPLDMMLVRPCDPGPRLKTYREKCFQFAGPKEWNNLPLLIRESPTIYIFKSRLKTYLFNCAFN